MNPSPELLEWYRARRSRYPWRASPTPYGALVSEVMLQQTQAARVAAAYPEFVRRFPTIEALAAASSAEVLRAWSGLGHNRRAIWLSRAARAIVDRHGAQVPSDPAVLVRLPGVGAYTAAAVASVAFNLPVAVVDTNVRRVVSRALLGRDPGAVKEGAVRAAARRWLDVSAPAAWNQAVMDLGRDVCRPAPRCPECPIARRCRLALRGTPGRRHVIRGRPVDRFRGSMRQVRGRIVAELLATSPATMAGLRRATATSPDVLARAVAALAEEGLVRAGPRALAGAPRGRVRLPP